MVRKINAGSYQDGGPGGEMKTKAKQHFFWAIAALIITIVAVIVPRIKLSRLDKTVTLERSWTKQSKQGTNPPPHKHNKPTPGVMTNE